jgi:hypothetical protein
LIQRNEAKKNQGKPDRSARFAWLAHMSIVAGFVRHIVNSNSLKTPNIQTPNIQTPNNKPLTPNPKPLTTNK